jgi:hypothetical protein
LYHTRRLANFILGWRKHYVPWVSRSYAEGIDSVGTVFYEDQDYRSSGTEVFHLDWWLYLGVFEYVSTNVDIETGV